ncbi:GTP-binding protein OBGC [Forsythia ovata]|uniref:GTP-binding protein OBGC n=1 Tax=Forsythia ovata TaxID=205694 RepID=A0ABD1WJN4_9LAMI
MAVTCIHTTATCLNITPRFLAAHRNPKTPQIRKLKSQKYSTIPQLSSLSAGDEATTFTRLPPVYLDWLDLTVRISQPDLELYVVEDGSNTGNGCERSDFEVVEKVPHGTVVREAGSDVL